MLCRQDWHQTSNQVVVTVYAKNPLPALSSVKANRTMVSGVEVCPLQAHLSLQTQESAVCQCSLVACYPVATNGAGTANLLSLS